MATPFSTVFDSFMGRIKDWKLDALYASSVTDFETYLTTFLTDSCMRFEDVSLESLEKDDTAKTFSEDLSGKVIWVLSQIMVEYWLEKEVQDVRQMNLKITDRDFKTYSEAQNLREKDNRWNEARERSSQIINDYAYKNNDWVAWVSGDFM